MVVNWQRKNKKYKTYNSNLSTITQSMQMVNILTTNFLTSISKTISKDSVISTFNYKSEIVTCGIPYINLGGIFED